jgi:hypothetical protein
MPTKLRKLKITRVAVCEQGANPDADIVLFKSLASPDVLGEHPQHLSPAPLVETQKISSPHAEPASDDIPSLDPLPDVSKAGAAMAGHRLTRLKTAIEALQAIFQECTPPEIEHDGISAAEAAGIPGAVNGRVPGQTIIPMTAQKGVAMTEEEKTAPVVLGDLAKEQVETLRKRAESAEARVKELEPQLATAAHDLATLQEELTVTKMSPEEQRERFLAGMSELVKKNYLAQEERLAVLEKSNHLLAETNERQSYIAKTADYRHLGMVPDDHWTILKAIDGMPEEPREHLLRLLKAADEQLRSGALFEARGLDARPVGGGTGSGTAESQIMALAQAHATEKGVGLDKAIEAIWKQHPDLWARDQQEKRMSNRVHSR